MSILNFFHGHDSYNYLSTTLLMSKKFWTVFTIATAISSAVTSIVSFYFTPALALSNNNNLFFNNDWSTNWIKQCDIIYC